MAKEIPSQYWLLKVEPSDYPFSKMKDDGKTTWNGIHNHQAQNYLKSMKCGDLAFYYHTEKEKAIVGIVKIVKEFYHNTDPKFGEVDVEYVRPLEYPVTLKMLKESTDLQSLTILKQPRLSVSSITSQQWDVIIELSNEKPIE
ncbi:thymocyte nuclear protein 1-like [Contarinia nasturtii]|uniref:thymocyte nuclear protein 1-like n=1 Tax=Contarinia nasturtii TaxID=265458 RepID=UPI0012D3B02F|nr:thymocyte nuclear protein 1-like [Contarinia nasturtii]